MPVAALADPTAEGGAKSSASSTASSPAGASHQRPAYPAAKSSRAASTPARSPVASRSMQQAARRPPARDGRGSGRRPPAGPMGRSAPRWRRASGPCRRRGATGSTRHPAAPARRGRRTGARSRPAPGRPGRPTSGGSPRPSRRGRPRRGPARRRCVLASTSRTTASRRPSLEPKWYRSMRWLVPTASAMRRRLWSASPSAVKCATTASRRRCRGATVSSPSGRAALRPSTRRPFVRHVPNGTFLGDRDVGGQPWPSR